ncbi:hypothetical protein F4781DRAFT_24644 [Annulohypoxylon bovei var. microspora]|nr:hypothetical protein F4781DRAFT_24644 [Annulohypoxylon bovei var. microspora]
MAQPTMLPTTWPPMGQPTMEQSNSAQPGAGHTIMPQPMILRPLLPQPLAQPMIPNGPYPRIVRPNIGQLSTSRPIYQLDDTYLPNAVMANPIPGNYVVSCSFNAIPLRGFSIEFRELSDYGKIIEECPNKLVIRIKHRNPETLSSIVRQAWVEKYIDPGVECRMHFGPLIQYGTLEITLERVNHLPLPTSPEHTPRVTTPSTSEMSTEDGSFLSTTNQDSEAGSEVTGGLQHPDENYDYFNEFQSQLMNQMMPVPAVLRPVPQMYQPYQSYGVYGDVPTYQGHQDHSTYPGHQENHNYQRYQGSATHLGYEENYDHQEYQGYQDHSTPRGHQQNHESQDSQGRATHLGCHNNRSNPGSAHKGHKGKSDNQSSEGHCTQPSHQESRNSYSFERNQNHRHRRSFRNRGYRGGRGGAGRSSSDRVLPGGSGRGTKRPREETTEDQPAASKEQPKKKKGKKK